MLVDMAVESLTERGVDVDGEVTYVWHFSNPSVADQNSWYVAGEEYIKENYPQLGRRERALLQQSGSRPVRDRRRVHP